MLIARPHERHRGSGAIGISEGYSSLRHSAFGAARYCSPSKDVLGQIGSFKMPALPDKGRREQLAQRWVFAALHACPFLQLKILLSVSQEQE